MLIRSEGRSGFEAAKSKGKRKKQKTKNKNAFCFRYVV